MVNTLLTHFYLIASDIDTLTGSKARQEDPFGEEEEARNPLKQHQKVTDDIGIKKLWRSFQHFGGRAQHEPSRPEQGSPDLKKMQENQA